MRKRNLQKTILQNAGKTGLIFGIILLLIASAMPATGRPLDRRGSTYRTDAVEISNISSKKLEKQKSGLIYYSFKAKVYNRLNRPITITVNFQAVDRSGYEVEEVIFFDKRIKARGTAHLSDRQVMKAYDYDHIWTWNVDSLRIK